MPTEPPPGPFHDADSARRRYWELARRAHDDTAVRAGDAPARAVGARSGNSAGAVLADEVAIDFPSMTPIVARMREAFFAAAGDRSVTTRRAEVELTARQADQGVRVPLDLTVEHTCPACGGRGELWTDPCGLCDGSGAGRLSHRMHFRVPPGVRHGTRLRYSVTPPHAFETHIEVRIAVQ